MSDWQCVSQSAKNILCSVETYLVQVNTIKEDEIVRVETQDWTGGQIRDDDSAEDMKNIDLSLVYYIQSWPCMISMLFLTCSAVCICYHHTSHAYEQGHASCIVNSSRCSYCHTCNVRHMLEEHV